MQERNDVDGSFMVVCSFVALTDDSYTGTCGHLKPDEHRYTNIGMLPRIRL